MYMTVHYSDSFRYACIGFAVMYMSVYALCVLIMSFSDSNCHLRLHSRNSSNGGHYINASFIDVSTPHCVSNIH